MHGLNNIYKTYAFENEEIKFHGCESLKFIELGRHLVNVEQYTHFLPSIINSINKRITIFSTFMILTITFISPKTKLVL